MKRSAIRREIATKSHSQIERDTARTWAERAMACFDRYAQTGDVKWILQGQNYADEALEHAALAGDGGRLVGELEAMMAKRSPMRTTRHSRRRA